MVREGLSEEAAIILRPGLKGNNQTYKNKQYKSLYTGTETESPRCVSRTEKKSSMTVPSKPGAAWCEIRQVGPGFVGSGGQWIGSTD